MANGRHNRGVRITAAVLAAIVVVTGALSGIGLLAPDPDPSEPDTAAGATNDQRYCAAASELQQRASAMLMAVGDTPDPDELTDAQDALYTSAAVTVLFDEMTANAPDGIHDEVIDAVGYIRHQHAGGPDNGITEDDMGIITARVQAWENTNCAE